MSKRALACTGCHGKQGVATPDGFFPRIAGKPAGYLLNQLRHFKSGARQFEGMNRLVGSLPDSYLRKFADYFANLELPYAPPAYQRLSAAEGKRATVLITEGDNSLRVPACASCHGEKLTGVLPAVPGLLGLPRDYLTAQLGAWKNGIRQAHAPDCMADIAERLPVQDITAIAGWLSAQPVPGDGKPVSAGQHHRESSTPQTTQDCGSYAAADLTSKSETQTAAALKGGHYLARLGNCAGCHRGAPSNLPSLASVSDNDALYGGGAAIETPFGRVYGSNISSSRSDGIGAWSADQFYRAMTEGIDAMDQALNPVFPYQFFAGLQRADSDALYAWFQSSQAVKLPNRAHDLRFPYDSRLALSAWRWLFVSQPVSLPAGASHHAASEPQVSAERGQYLVETLMHCNACHGERNFLGGFTRDDKTGGQQLPGNAGYAPSLDDVSEAGVTSWSLEEIESFLLVGSNRHADANGLMARIVQESTQYLTPIDAASAALYLKTGFARSSKNSIARNHASTGSSISQNPLWRDNCAACHADNGTGKPGLGPSLAGRRSVQVSDPANVIVSILHGGFGPATRMRPHPPGMPGFGHRLRDQEVATLATMVRQSWGNQAAAVRAVDVQRLR
ncbi:MAG: c-type cytochrome [Burkholderiaceae bacterium]